MVFEDKENIVKFCMENWIMKENEAYAEILSKRNRLIAQLQQAVNALCQENCRLAGVIRSYEEFTHDDLTQTEELTRPRVRRRLTYEDSETESEDFLSALDIADEMFRVITEED